MVMGWLCIAVACAVAFGGLGLLWGMFSSLLMLVGFKWPSVLYYVLFLMFLVTPLLTGSAVGVTRG